jgi:integrase
MKSLEEYLKEFESHLRESTYARGTKTGYELAVKMLLCNVIPLKQAEYYKMKRQGKAYDYTMKHSPDKLTWGYVKDYILRLKAKNIGSTQNLRLSGIKEYLYFIRSKYNNNTLDEYEQELRMFPSKRKRDIFKADRHRPKETIILTDEEILDMLEKSQVNLRDHIIIRLLCGIGQRKMSIEGINVQDLNPQPQKTNTGTIYYDLTINILKGKYSLPEKNPISPELKELIDKYLKSREEPKQKGYILDNYENKKLYHKDAMFLNGTGGRYTKDAIYKMVKRYGDKCGIQKRVYPHLFRHVMSTKLRGAGLSDGMVKLYTHHAKNSTVLNNYDNPLKDEAVDKGLKILNPKKEIQESQEPKQQQSQEEPTKEELLQMIAKLQKEKDELINKKYDMNYQ